MLSEYQYAISVPRIEQTASKTLAQKAIAYGIPGIQVDGNDIFAMYVATKEAADRARRGEGPTLIEAITYRLAAHTTSDDPTKYREDAEVEEWKTRDPILRFKTYLENKGILTKEWDEKMKKEVENEITSTFEEIEGKADTKIEEIFMYHYETMPPILEEQLKEYKDFLEGGKIMTNKINMVQAVNQALINEMELDDRVIVYGEDVGLEGGVFRATVDLQQKFEKNAPLIHH